MSGARILWTALSRCSLSERASSTAESARWSSARTVNVCIYVCMYAYTDTHLLIIYNAVLMIIPVFMHGLYVCMCTVCMYVFALCVCMYV